MQADRRAVFDIKLGIMIAMFIISLGSMVAYSERRITTVEVKLSEQMKGYTVVFQEVNRRLDRFERKLDKVDDQLTDLARRK